MIRTPSRHSAKTPSTRGADHVDRSVTFYQDQEQSIMNPRKWRPSLVKQVCEAALESPIFQDSDTNEEYDREFREFIESISMTTEELAAIVGMAESSTAEAKQSLRYVKITSPRQNPSSLGRAVPGVGVGLVINGGSAARNLG